MFWTNRKKLNLNDKDLTMKALHLLSQEIDVLDGTEILGGWVAWDALRKVDDDDSSKQLNSNNCMNQQML